jgi:hypothetical protein
MSVGPLGYSSGDCWHGAASSGLTEGSSGSEWL